MSWIGSCLLVKCDVCVTTNDIICKALFLLSNFKQNDEKKLQHCMHAFMKCYNLTVRNATRVAEKTSVNLERVRKDQAKKVMITFLNEISYEKKSRKHG